jgi:hypothetical protein
MTATTQSSPVPGTVARPGTLPSRRLLVVLGCLYAALFVGLLATGGDRSPADDPTELIAGYTLGDVTVQVMTYAAMIAAALLVFFGAGLRAVLLARAHRWTGDAAFIGFVAMAWTLAGFAVTSLALHHAVASGDTHVVRAINILDTTNFPPAMIGLMCAMVGVGVTALAGHALPRWLAWGSIVLGAMAPLGPGGFVPFMLFPVWLVAVAAVVRRD